MSAGFARSFHAPREAIVRKYDRTRTLCATLKCSSAAAKSEKSQEISAGEFFFSPTYCTFAVQHGSSGRSSRHCTGKWWKRCKCAYRTQLGATDLGPSFKVFTQDFCFSPLTCRSFCQRYRAKMQRLFLQHVARCPSAVDVVVSVTFKVYFPT